MLQATALEVQKLLISGRLKDALQCAQEGQLWGPALALAAQLGDQVVFSLTSLFCPAFSLSKIIKLVHVWRRMSQLISKRD